MSQLLSKQILNEVQAIASGLSSLKRQINRMDERLVDVEGHVTKMRGQITEMQGHTELIPGIAEAVTAQSGDLDNHEQRLKQLEGTA